MGPSRGPFLPLLAALAACGAPEPVAVPPTPEALAVELGRVPGPEVVTRTLEIIRRNPGRWGPSELDRLRSALVRRASASSEEDPVAALYVLLEARNADGDPFAELSDLLRVHNRSPDPGVRAAVVKAVPGRWEEGAVRRFLTAVASAATGRDAPSAEAAVLGLGRLGGAACAELEELLAGRRIPDAGAAALARALVDEELPAAPDLPDRCRMSGWARILDRLL